MARTFEQDVFDAIRANWTADAQKWGRAAAEGVPAVRDVERWGSDKAVAEPSVHVRFASPRRQPTADGTPRWDVVAELVLRFNSDTQLPSTNYAGLRDEIVQRIVAQLDDADLSGVSGASHLLGRAQVLGVYPRDGSGETTIRVLCVGEEV